MYVVTNTSAGHSVSRVSDPIQQYQQFSEDFKRHAQYKGVLIRHLWSGMDGGEVRNHSEKFVYGASVLTHVVFK